MKNILYGSGDMEPAPESCAMLAQEVYNCNLLIILIQNLNLIDFEVS